MAGSRISSQSPTAFPAARACRTRRHFGRQTRRHSSPTPAHKTLVRRRHPRTGNDFESRKQFPAGGTVISIRRVLPAMPLSASNTATLLTTTCTGCAFPRAHPTTHSPPQVNVSISVNEIQPRCVRQADLKYFRGQKPERCGGLGSKTHPQGPPQGRPCVTPWISDTCIAERRAGAAAIPVSHGIWHRSTMRRNRALGSRIRRSASRFLRQSWWFRAFRPASIGPDCWIHLYDRPFPAHRKGLYDERY